LEVKPRCSDLSTSPIPLAITGEDFQILEYTRALAPFFEKGEDERFDTLIEILGEVPDSFIRAYEENKNCVETLPIISKSGRLRWVRTSLYTTNLKNNFQVVFDDVTVDKEQFELAMQAKQIARIGSWKVDLVNNNVSWSDATKEIHEVPQEFVPNLEKGIDFYKKGVHRDRIVEAVSECMETGNPFDLELIIVTAKGNEKWVRAIGEAETSNGKTIGFRGVFQDIDEMKRERLRNQTIDDRMRMVVESANIGIWDWDVVANDLSWDNNMFAIFDIEPGRFANAYEAWECSLHPEDKEKAVFEVELALKGEKDFDTVFRIIKSDGSIAYIQGRAQVMRNKAGQPIRMVGMNTDITKIKRKDERLRNLLELTEKQNQKLVNFAHIVSHNLRSNSTNISMLSGMLMSQIGRDRIGEFLGMIQESSEKLEETLNQLNEIVRIQTTDKSDLRPVLVKTILENVCTGLNAIIKESKATIAIELKDDLKVMGIKPYISSVIHNLLTNSIKYQKPENPPIISIKARQLDNQTILIFKDNGLGIDLKKHSKNLFGMYKTFHGNKDAKGIGLFISKNQMEAMDGKIEVESKLGFGTSFMLYFKNEQ